MEIRQLQYAVLLAEHRHFGKAAAHAFITQSALSQQISRLESHLKVRLFERSSGGVKLTIAGETFVERAHGTLSSLGSLEEDIRAIARGYSGVLRVGTFGATAGEFTPQLMTEFKRALPQIELKFHELSMADQFAQLLSGRVDVALLHPLYDRDDIVFTNLFDEPRCAAVPAHHALAASSELSISDLVDEPFVTACAGTPASWRNFWICSDKRVSVEKTSRVEMNSVSEGLYAVAHLDVFDTVPSTITRFHQHPGVTFLPLNDAEYSSVAVAHRVGDRTPIVEAFCELASRLAVEHYSIVPGAVRLEHSM